MESIQEVIEYLKRRVAELEKEHKEYHHGFDTCNWDEGDIGYSWAITELNLIMKKICERKHD